LEVAGLKEKSIDGSDIINSLNKDEKKAAKYLIKNLNIDFDSRNFLNPSI
jgi:hypothetical protein